MNWLQPLLWIAVVVTAIAQVSAVQSHRDLLQVWQQADATRQSLMQEHNRLVLEKSTLMSHSRIERQARKELHMQVPRHTQVFR
ncbi:MAG: cell division protein FtsL [Oleibacter sp.]|nr:cell division protein FtsL [Thalassolituus sp.]